MRERETSSLLIERHLWGDPTRRPIKFYGLVSDNYVSRRSCQKCRNVVFHFVEQPLAGFARAPGRVWSDNQVIEFVGGFDDRVIGWRGLARNYVERRGGYFL